jgi:fumarate reductase subunit D
MKENFFEFTFKHLSVDILISAIIYGLLSSLIDDVLMPLFLQLIAPLNLLEPSDKKMQFKNFAQRIIFTLAVLIIIYISSISIKYLNPSL